jgi:hypothetical protein
VERGEQSMQLQTMQLDPVVRAMFASHNRRRRRVKLLFYEAQRLLDDVAAL